MEFLCSLLNFGLNCDFLLTTEYVYRSDTVDSFRMFKMGHLDSTGWVAHFAVKMYFPRVLHVACE